MTDSTRGLVLIASRSEILRALLERALAREGFEPELVSTGSEGHAALRRNGRRGVLLIDAELLAAEGAEAWAGLLERWPGLRLVATSHALLDDEVRRLVQRHRGVAVECPSDFVSVTRAVAAQAARS